MKQIAKKLSLLIITFSFVFSALVPAVTAQGQEKGEGIGISPTQLDLKADPGQTLKGNFTVLNTGTSSIRYKTYVEDFRIRNEDYEKDFEPTPGATSPKQWITVPSTGQELAAGKQKELEYQVQVPKGALAGGYYAVVFAETVQPQLDATGVARVKRVGMLVYITVSGDTVEKGSIASFDVDFFQSRPVKTSLRMQNDGNVHFRAEGQVRLKDIFGRQIALAPISGTILPSTIRKYNSELKLNQPFGLYRVEGEVTYLGNTTKLPGKWVLVGSPFWAVLWTVLIIGWILVLIRWIRRRAKSKKVS